MVCVVAALRVSRAFQSEGCIIAHKLVLVRLPIVCALVVIIRIRIGAAVVPQNAAGVPIRHPLVGTGSIIFGAHHVAGGISASVVLLAIDVH